MISREDFLVFEATPGKRVVFLPDLPSFTIVAASKDMRRFVGRTREQMVGKSVFEAFPANPADPDFTGHKNLLLSLEYVVLNKAGHQMEKQRYDVAAEDGTFKEIYWQNTSTPVLNEEGHVAYIIHTAEDITERIKADELRKRMKGLEQAYHLFLQAPTVICITRGKNHVLELVNTAALQLWHKTAGIVGQPLAEAIPEFAGQMAFNEIDRVYESGKPFQASEVEIKSIKEGKEVISYFDVHYQPYFDEGSTAASGVFTLSNNVTDKVLAKRKTEESEARFRSLIEEAPVATCLFVGREMVIEVANEAMIQVWGKGPGVMGLPLAEALPELKGQHFLPLLDNLFATGNTYSEKGGRADLVVDGRLQTFYFDYDFKPLRKADGTIYAILETAIDVTGQVLAQRKIAESQRSLLTLFEESPVGIATLGITDGFVFEFANAFYGSLVDRQPGELMGKPLLEALPELKGQGFEKLLREVATTGLPFEAKELPAVVMRAGRLETIFIDFTYHPRRDAKGDITGILVVVINVTEQVLARKKVEQSEAKLKSLIAAAPIAIGLFIGRDLVIENPNQEFIDIVGKGPDISGKRLTDVMPELVEHGQPYLKILDDVFTTGVMYQSLGDPVNIVRHGVMHNGFYNIYYVPLFDAEGKVYGIMDIATDVTEQIISRQKLAQSEKNFRNMILQAPVAMCIFKGADYVVEIANERMFELWGKEEADVLGKPIFEGLPEARGQGFEELLFSVYTTGKTVRLFDVPITLPRNGKLEVVYVNFVYEAFREGDDSISGIMAVASDVTEQVMARKKIEEIEEALRNMVLAAPVGMCVLEAPSLVSRIVNESFIEIAGKPYEAIVGHWYWDTFAEAKPYYEEALQGVVNNGVPYYANEVELMLIRYGKEEIVYVTFVYMPLKNVEGVVTKVAIYVLENTPQVAARRKIEEIVQQRTQELAAANETLQTINKELQRSNANLEEFAHAASHDLKEPIRKITFFTQQLRDQLANHLKEAEQRSFSRIQNATERMGNLIDDLLLYSHVSQRPHETEAIDLNEKIKRVLEDLELDVQEKQAIIKVEKLPVVQGYRRQLQQLFQNLISNALKYSKAGEPPQISIAADTIKIEGKAYNVIKVQDNGIGFEQQYADKIFQMFSRLHGKSEYSGTGVGLSIVKKVVENHNGFIEVESTVGEGAEFKVYLPV